MVGKIVKFDNIINARDFGGLKRQPKGRVVKNKLYRGAQISSMTKRDERIFIDLAIDLIIDFRYRGERERQKSKFTHRFKPDLLVYDPKHDLKDTKTLAPHERFMLNDLADKTGSRNYMLESYRTRPHAPGFMELTARSIKYLAAHGPNIYVHCAAGKDRTGTFVAILLLALGCSEDDVMKDFMRTAEVVELDLIVQMASKRLENYYGRIYDPESLWPFFGVEPAYLQQSLNAMGDFDTYFHKTLGLSHKVRDQLCKQYTT